ncbi:fluoride exporter [Staphylococcus hominis]
MQYVTVFIGGTLGALLRFLFSFMNHSSTFPIGTLIANLSGAFLMGYLSVVMIKLFKDYPKIKKGVTTGFLGALTTFSTFQFELVTLLHNYHILLAVVYAFTSYTLGVVLCWIGMKLGGRTS